jgi:hypothetical protein
LHILSTILKSDIYYLQSAEIIQGGFLTGHNNRDDAERLNMVRNHASNGFYNRQDIVAATASAVIRSQALHIILDRYELEHPGSKGHILAEDPKITEIRQKIDAGYYDDPNNIAELVEKLIKKLEIE